VKTQLGDELKLNGTVISNVIKTSRGLDIPYKGKDNPTFLSEYGVSYLLWKD